MNSSLPCFRVVQPENHRTKNSRYFPLSLSPDPTGQPPPRRFDIVAFSKDSSSLVIDVTNFYGTDVKAISGLPSFIRKQYKVKNLDKSKDFDKLAHVLI